MSPEAFAAVCNNLPQQEAGKWYQALTAASEEYGINVNQRFEMWLANMCHESNRFTRLVENLNYSAKRLAEVWPSRFAANPDEKIVTMRMPNELANVLGGKPELIANSIYANRYGNGPPGTGDGWRYRGRYPCQLTFRSAYEAANMEVGVPDLEAPDLLLNDYLGMARVCAWFWNWKGLSSVSDAGDFSTVCRKWNGGPIGMSDRVVWLSNVLEAQSLYG